MITPRCPVSSAYLKISSIQDLGSAEAVCLQSSVLGRYLGHCSTGHDTSQIQVPLPASRAAQPDGPNPARMSEKGCSFWVP